MGRMDIEMDYPRASLFQSVRGSMNRAEEILKGNE